MDTIILAGGYAKRLWPLTGSFPKALLAIAGKPVLHHSIESVAKIPDLQRLIIAIDEGHTTLFAEAIKTFKESSGIQIILSAHKERSKTVLKSPIEKLSELLINAKENGLKSSRLLVVGADNVFGFPLAEFADFQRQAANSCIAIQSRPASRDASEFGVPTLDQGGRVIKFDEKPVKRMSYTMISTACYIFLREDIELVHTYLNDSPEETLGSFIRWLAARRDLTGFKFPDEWFDIGTRDGILSANRFLLYKDARSQTHPNLVSGRSHIIDPVFIDKNVIIQDSTIGPNVYISSRSKIINSVIKNSIIYGDSKIVDCDLENSIIGTGSVVEGRVSEAVFGPQSQIATDR